MAIGANWAEIWNEAIWDPVWTQDAVTPEPESTQRPAGRPRLRRRLLVEINGQDFEVASPDEARALLEQARQVAAAAIQKVRTVSIRVGGGIQRPRIVTEAPELKEIVAEARRDIVGLFDGLARDFEIAALMRKRVEDQDEEEALIQFLM